MEVTYNDHLVQVPDHFRADSELAEGATVQVFRSVVVVFIERTQW